MATGFPNPVSGRVSDETLSQIEQAKKDFGVTEGGMVRLALEDYMPRYLANRGKPQHAELFAKLSEVLGESPELAHDLIKLTKKATRRRRVEAATA